MTRPLILAATLALTALALPALGGCEKQVKAPLDTGVCWHAVTKDGKLVFNQVSTHEASIETCAASLEAMRLRFLGLGGTVEELTGAYQGQFLFLQKEGVFTSQSLKGARYLMLVRTGGGQLAKLGAQPVAP